MIIHLLLITGVCRTPTGDGCYCKTVENWCHITHIKNYTTFNIWMKANPDFVRIDLLY